MVLIPVGKLNETVGAGLLVWFCQRCMCHHHPVNCSSSDSFISLYGITWLKRLSFETATTISIAYFRV